MKKWVLFIAAILTLCSSVARADDPNDSNKKAIEIYSALAARYMLAKIYLNGKGVTQDYKEAVKWYLLAAEQGSASAQYNLGVMYDNGEGVIQDYVRAHMWFNLVTSKGSKKGRENREKATKIMTPAQIAEAQKMAREYEKNNCKNCE